MRRTAFLLLAALISALVLGEVSAMAEPGQNMKRPQVEPSGAEVAGSSDLDGLTTEQLVGQRVIASYEGPTPPESLLELIRQGEVAGVIFFGENIKSKGQIRRVISDLQQARLNSDLPPALQEPLLMMTDQEGGIVRRLRGAPELSEKEIGESAHPVKAAYRAGRGAGHNLASVGMNVNLAPVLGVSRNNGGFLDEFERLYGDDPREIAKLGSAFIFAQQEGSGVAATAKHFPGLGAAITDTDSAPVTLNLPLDVLRNVDEYPYHDAIGVGTELVMISNATYPALDPIYPASLSRTVIQDELRERLGFEGVTITDALEAGGLSNFGPVPERGVLAAKAGADLLLFSAKDISEGIAGSAALEQALGDETLDLSEYERSAQRVLDLRARLGAGDIGLPDSGLRKDLPCATHAP